MKIKIGDTCHIKNYRDGYWIGKVSEIYDKVDDYIFGDPILYIFGNDISDPHFISIRESELTLIGNGEWQN